MDSEYGGTSVGNMTVNTSFILHAFEAPGFHSIMECLVPYTACLFHIVNALSELHDPIFLA